MWPFERKPGNLPSGVEKIFEKLHRFLTEEDVQNESYSPEIRREIQSNAKSDVIAGAQGEFGFDPRNPIPVNGPIGELIYLSSLDHLSGQKIAFHRLGSVSKIDVYEVMSLDGNHWNVLFLNMYYAGKSRRAPKGFRISESTPGRFLRGVNVRVDSFPAGLYASAAAFADRVFGMTLVDEDLKKLDAAPPRRPETHSHLIQTIGSSVDGWHGDAAPSQRIRFKWCTMKDMENRADISLIFATLPNGTLRITCEQFPGFQAEYASMIEAEERLSYALSEHLAGFAGGPVMIFTPEGFGG